MKKLYQAPEETWWSWVVSEVTLSLLFIHGVCYPVYLPILAYFLLFVFRLETSVLIVAFCWSSLWWAKWIEWPTFGRTVMFDSWRRHFSFCVFSNLKKMPSHCIIAVVPHGVFPLSLILLEGVWQDIFPSVPRPATAIADIFFNLPFLCPMMEWLGGISASKERMLEVLKTKSTPCLVLPDGIAGVYHPTKIFLRERKGFAELALQTNVPIVPVYCTGHDHLFSVFPTHDQAPWVVALSRRLRFALVAYWPFRPAKAPLSMIIGELVSPRSGDTVDSLHQRFIEEGLKNLNKDIQIA